MGKCLCLLKKQTFQNFEIVIVDDCSTDNSMSYLINQIQKYPNIKLIQHMYNQGTCLSRCHAIIYSKGDYIMTLDPDDEYLNYTIENSYKQAIQYDADVLEYDALTHRIKSGKKFYNKCQKKFIKSTELLIKFQKYKYFETNWNIWKRIIKRKIYLKAINLFYPFIKNKKICNGEDILHCGTIYLFMKNYICGKFLGYIYYNGLNNSAFTNSYDSRRQSATQVTLSRTLSQYFYSKKDDLSSCSLEDFLSNKNNSALYNKVANIKKIPIKSCSVNFVGIISSEIKEQGCCIIENINIY